MRTKWYIFLLTDLQKSTLELIFLFFPVVTPNKYSVVGPELTVVMKRRGGTELSDPLWLC